jgi:hypothetical protein
MHSLSQPINFALNLNSLLHKSPGAARVFVASNSGTEEEVQEVKRRSRCSHCTCFSGTRVQILTQKLQAHQRASSDAP